jgi:glyoxylase-like metal-dependent hydrolase (beta-lactamase superfamily II)
MGGVTVRVVATRLAMGPDRLRRLAGVVAGAAAIASILGAACSRAVAPLVEPRASAVALTGGPGTSMVYLARTGAGIVAIDLGWWGSADAVRDALAELGATPDSVRDVFLTHSHRDHIGAWRLVARSRFHLALDEAEPFLGERPHDGAVPRLVERVKPADLPEPGELAVRTFSTDTAFVLGADTLRAYIVPGHTAGSAVYLFRGILFLGDAATYTRWGGYGPARGIYSDDRGRAIASLDSLWKRLPRAGVERVCTAHARCRPFDDEFITDVAP